tara:strand:- start:169 stop:369 length:201 start_codon:yes stop_codon:yes gene_type:complete
VKVKIIVILFIGAVYWVSSLIDKMPVMKDFNDQRPCTGFFTLCSYAFCPKGQIKDLTVFINGIELI